MPLRSAHASSVLQAVWHLALSLPQASELKLSDNGSGLVTVIPTEDANSPAGRATLGRLRAATVAGEVTIGGEAAQGDLHGGLVPAELVGGHEGQRVGDGDRHELKVRNDG